jgi:hypothetical protein
MRLRPGAQRGMLLCSAAQSAEVSVHLSRPSLSQDRMNLCECKWQVNLISYWFHSLPDKYTYYYTYYIL